MNELPMRYEHVDHTRVPRDVRRKQLANVSWEDIYYVGFQVQPGHYHHALILADNHESLLDGIVAERREIQGRQPEVPAEEIKLVFVRNLLMRTPEIRTASDELNITREITEKLCRRDDHLFMVLGLIEETDLYLMQQQTVDALMAIRLSRFACAKRCKNKFVTLEVCQMHPVTKECYILFDAVAERVRTLLGAEAQEGGYLH